MRLTTVLGAAAISGALLLIGGTANADPSPAGSYRASCNDISAERGRLAASCRTRDGRWTYTELDHYRDCSGDIANIDGQLRCSRGEEEGDRWGDGRDHGDDRDRGDDHDSGWTPRGSYHDSCRNERASHGTLRAKCRDRYGRWRYSDLENFRSCEGDIYNDNGALRCRHGRDDERWGGGGDGRSEITLYKDSEFRGGSRTFDRDVPDLSTYGFADAASSAALRGGVWQVCTRPNYRGRCVTIDRNVSNFDGTGLNDQIESLRPLRR